MPSNSARHGDSASRTPKGPEPNAAPRAGDVQGLAAKSLLTCPVENERTSPGQGEDKDGASAVCQMSNTIHYARTASGTPLECLHCSGNRLCLFGRLASCSLAGNGMAMAMAMGIRQDRPTFRDRGPLGEHVTVNYDRHLNPCFVVLVCLHPLSVSPWQSCIRRLRSAPLWPRRSRSSCFLHSTSASRNANPPTIPPLTFGPASRPTLRCTATG